MNGCVVQGPSGMMRCTLHSSTAKPRGGSSVGPRGSWRANGSLGILCLAGQGSAGVAELPKLRQGGVNCVVFRSGVTNTPRGGAVNCAQLKFLGIPFRSQRTLSADQGPPNIRITDTG